jgi:hypothetical protein
MALNLAPEDKETNLDGGQGVRAEPRVQAKDRVRKRLHMDVFGVLDSFKLGGIEVRNIPVGWSEPAGGGLPPETNDGLIGTSFFYHLLTTFDYAGRSLILRRPTPEAARSGHSAPATQPSSTPAIRRRFASATPSPRRVYCYPNPNQPGNVPWPYGTGFDAMGWFAHSFWKPYNITLDFTDMNLYIARGKAT